ncbi:MAG: phosphoribosylamine--glycine ligase [Coriobacteriales bacterium]|jgi:phosphoribosylamine--glycine ligase|nr:phosphoribosylamine--glycine ligase [Coriobacteriales bacterium]
MNILVVGSGGREHAIVHSLCASDESGQIFVAPGNGGTAGEAKAENVPAGSLDVSNAADVVTFAQEHDIKLVVIGPEAPLVAGVADAVRDAHIACFGPGARGAQLEGSKLFSKELMTAHGIPTAAYGSFTDKDSALAYVAKQGAPIVIKADGLAGGKGVTVAATTDEATRAVEECFAGRFGDAGTTVVIEECLSGAECSLLAFTDGDTVLPMVPAQDHKRAYDGDKGPNTGGMGAYSPVPIVSESEYDSMIAIMEQTVRALNDEGIDYRGVLYGGFMLTEDGPKVLEFNVRFGDPECQVVLPRLKTDLLRVMCATANGTLGDIELEWYDDYAITVVLASAGYPGSYDTGKPISGINDAEALGNVTVYHAGTKAEDGVVLTDGGRVLDVTALGPTFAAARDKAYKAIDLIDFDGKQYRSDIGHLAE